MVGFTRARLACAALALVHASPAHAESLTIDLNTARARARERAPEAIVAAAKIGEAEAGVAGAGVLAPNPEVELGIGPRFSDPRTIEMALRITQPLELGRRGKRIAVANAEVDHARAERDAARRQLDLVVATTFSEARHADLVIGLAVHTEAVAVRAVAAAERRRKAGDITDLDVDLAKVALGRARSAVATARAERAAALGRLAALIGAKPDDRITLAGELVPPALEVEHPIKRADVVALDRATGVARAEVELAQALGLPEVGVWFGAARDENVPVLLGGVRFTLPLWNRAQGAKATARTRLRSVKAERTAVLSAAVRQIGDATEAYTHAREAVEVFDRDVLPSLVDAERLLERSIDAGQIAVSEYLVARAETLTARREQLDRQLALAKAWAAAQHVGGSR